MLTFHRLDNKIIAELTDETLIIAETQDVLDIMGDAGVERCNRLVIHEKNLHADFFRLHTGLAGEILQKFSTYSFKLAIVGEFSKYRSKSLQDFIRESNRGNRIYFVDSLSDAIYRL